MQNRKHHSKLHSWGLSFTIILLLLVASVARADSSQSVISLITASIEVDQNGNPILDVDGHTIPNLDENGNPVASGGNATFSSVTYDGKDVAFDSFAKDLNESKVSTTYSDIFLSVDNGDGTKTIHRIAGSESVDNSCDKAPDRCNSGFPVISRKSQSGNANVYSIAFSSSAKLGSNDLPGSCGMFGFNCKSIFLANVDLTDPTHPIIQQVSVGTSSTPENGNSGYQDLSLISPVNVLHPVADVYESNGDGAGGTDVNGAKAGDAVVVFESDATNLVANDKNLHKDIFLRDMGNPQASVNPSPTVLLTKMVDSKGKITQPNGDSSDPVITDDGKYMAFVSTAKNLATNTTGNPQVYLLDITKNKFYLVSRVIANNTPGDGESRYPSIIENGSIVEVAFHSTSTNLAAEANNGIANIYVYTLDTSKSVETLDLVSRGSSPDHTVNSGDVGNMDSLTPYLSSNGGAVTFSSYADNLIEGANNYNCPAITLHGQLVTKCKDIYVSDLSAHQTWRVSLTSAGEQAQSNSAFPALSGDGRLVSFTSYVDIFGTGGQSDKMQIYQRDQGIPLGNPVIQPSSWNFYAQANQTSARTFTITSLSPTTQLLSKDGSYTGLALDQKVFQGGKWVDEVGDQTDNFTLDKQTCTDGSFLLTYQYCTFQVTFNATDMDGKSAVLYVPINDIRQEVAIALQGRTIVSYFPLMILH
ncbi:MAG: hypothetical protein P4L50_28530 [Anaerolineaceae bacterium]|nr:hypothetical protein [Anaerolineaceae bacterium]